MKIQNNDGSTIRRRRMKIFNTNKEEDQKPDECSKLEVITKSPHST